MKTMIGGVSLRNLVAVHQEQGCHQSRHDSERQGSCSRERNSEGPAGTTQRSAINVSSHLFFLTCSVAMMKSQTRRLSISGGLDMDPLATPKVRAQPGHVCGWSHSQRQRRGFRPGLPSIADDESGTEDLKGENDTLRQALRETIAREKVPANSNVVWAQSLMCPCRSCWRVSKPWMRKPTSRCALASSSADTNR